MSVVPAGAVMEQIASLARPGHYLQRTRVLVRCVGVTVRAASGPWGPFRVLDQDRHGTVLEAEACWPVWL